MAFDFNNIIDIQPAVDIISNSPIKSHFDRINVDPEDAYFFNRDYCIRAAKFLISKNMSSAILQSHTPVTHMHEALYPFRLLDKTVLTLHGIRTSYIRYTEIQNEFHKNLINEYHIPDISINPVEFELSKASEEYLNIYKEAIKNSADKRFHYQYLKGLREFKKIEESGCVWINNSSLSMLIIIPIVKAERNLPQELYLSLNEIYIGLKR